MTPPPPSLIPPLPSRRTTWTLRQNILRALWIIFGQTLWAIFPPFRGNLLRAFGASIGRGCTFGIGVEVAIPWNLRIGDAVRVGDRVILYSLGQITLGDGCVLDYRAHLCAGTHDMADPRFPLLTPPITVGPRSFIGIDAYLAPGVALGPDSRVWPRASVYKGFPAGTTLRGNPARPVPEDLPIESASDAVPAERRA